MSNLNSNQTIGGLNVKFHRYHEEEELHGNSINRIKTLCVISDDDNNVINEVTVTKHGPDKDDKQVARKYAFKKAIMTSDLNKIERTHVWNDYKQRVLDINESEEDNESNDDIQGVTQEVFERAS